MTASPRSRPAEVTGRPGDGPVAGSFEVVGHKVEGVYRVLTFAAPELARRARPGQFVEVAVEGAATLLRRPFSIADVTDGGPGGGTVTIVYDVHGAGTEWMARIEVHDHLQVLGPLGVPFPQPNRPVSTMLVAGGYGAAPLFWLGTELRRAGNRVDLVVGAQTEGRIHRAIEAKRVSETVAFTTDDGSYGTKGRVTDVLPDRMESCSTDLVYAVGPNAMLRAVAELCAELEVACQVSVEEHMACGVGVCWTCVVPCHAGDEVVNRRACVDGPVFDARRIAWEQSRWSTGPAPVEDEEPPPPPRRPTSSELFG